MLITFPVAFYTGTLVGFAVYATNGYLFWLNVAIALSIAGTGTAVLATLAGLAGWALGIPRDSAAKTIGLAHAGLNVIALGLFLAAMASYVTNWNGPAISATLGVVLSAIGVAVTIAAGFLGWTPVQDYHVGVRLAPSRKSPSPASSTTSPQSLSRRGTGTQPKRAAGARPGSVTGYRAAPTPP